MDVIQLCNICFTNLNDKRVTEDIILLVSDILKRNGLLVLREEGIVSDYLRIYKEKKEDEQ